MKKEELIQLMRSLDATINALDQPGENWRDSTEADIREIAEREGCAPIHLRRQLYTELEIRAACNLTSRRERMKARLEKHGATVREREAVTKLDIISRDRRLRAIFEGIVQKRKA